MESSSTNQQGPGRLWKKLLLCGMSFLIALLAAEVAVRLFALGPPQYRKPQTYGAGQVRYLQEGGFYLHTPGSTFWDTYDVRGDDRGYLGKHGEIFYQINQYGLRGPNFPLEKTPGTLRILCLGDSFTFGAGVLYADTFPARLETILPPLLGGQAVQGINAGIAAAGTRQEVAQLKHQGIRFQPDVVVLGFFLNDATDHQVTIQQSDASTDTDAQGLGKWSRLFWMMQQPHRTRRVQEEFFRTTRESFTSPEWEECQKAIKEMVELSQRHNFYFLVVIFPILWDLDENYPFADIHDLVKQACTASGCDVLDLLEVYRGRPASSLWVHPTDHHPNELAHELAAEAIARQLAEKLKGNDSP